MNIKMDRAITFFPYCYDNFTVPLYMLLFESSLLDSIKGCSIFSACSAMLYTRKLS